MKKMILSAAAAAALTLTGISVYAEEEAIPEEVYGEYAAEVTDETVYRFNTEDREEVIMYFSQSGEYMGCEISVNDVEPFFPESDSPSGIYYSSAEDIPLKDGEIVETVGADGDPWRKFYVLSADMNDPYAYYAGHEVYKENTGGENGYLTNSPVSGNTSLSALSAAAACALGVSLFTSKKREYGRKNCKK